MEHNYPIHLGLLVIPLAVSLTDQDIEGILHL